MQRQRQPGPMRLGLLFLAMKIYGMGLWNIPPVTLLFVLGQAALFVRLIALPWNATDVCLSGESILIYQDYQRLFLSAIEHAHDFHLYHNMASLLIKGKTLEIRHGSLKFFILLIVFIFSTSGVYVLMAKAAYNYLDDYSYMKQCAIGFSGVLFALKVLTTFEEPMGSYWIPWFNVSLSPIPSKYVVWVELLIIHILVPRSSFMGHLAGIFVGLLYIQGPLKIIVRALHDFLEMILCPQHSNGASPDRNGFRSQPSYTYARGHATHQGNYQEASQSQSYGWNTDGYNDNVGNIDADELRRRRMNRFAN